MKFICDLVRGGVRILRCFGYDGQVEIPERIHGTEVRELGAYAFADIVRRREAGGKYIAQVREDAPEEGSFVWDWEECPEALLDKEALEDGTPVVKGQKLRSVSLPAGVKKIGAYAFYLCERMEKLCFFSTISDLGAGLFTGCLGVSELNICMVRGEKSCLKEVLAEFRQTLRVRIYEIKDEIAAQDEVAIKDNKMDRIIDGGNNDWEKRKQGALLSRLVFPEYFEESIENTPARILTQEVHGCGHRYRNAFSGTQLQYVVYDKLFAHIQVQESAELVTELAFERVRFPVQLGEERKKVYEEYLAAHGREIVKLAFRCSEEMTEILEFAGNAGWCGKTCMDEMLDEAGQRGNPIAMGVLMELGRRQRMAGGHKKERNGVGEDGKEDREAEEGSMEGREQEFRGRRESGGRQRRFVL